MSEYTIRKARELVAALNEEKAIFANNSAQWPTAPSPANEGTETPQAAAEACAKEINNEADFGGKLTPSNAVAEISSIILKFFLPLFEQSYAFQLERELTAARHQAEQLEATVAELKGHHQRDEEMIVQCPDELRVLSGDYRELLNDTADVSKDNISLRFQLASADGERKRLRTALEGVLNSAVHPDIALRAVMVDLIPVRSALGSTPPTTKEGKGEA